MGGHNSENNIGNTFVLVLTVHQEAETKSLSAVLSGRLLFNSYDDVQKSRFTRAHLKICTERFYSEVGTLPELFAIIYVANNAIIAVL